MNGKCLGNPDMDCTCWLSDQQHREDILDLLKKQHNISTQRVDIDGTNPEYQKSKKELCPGNYRPSFGEIIARALEPIRNIHW